MADGVGTAELVAHRYDVLRAHLDERQRRLLLGVEASQMGRGGIKAIAAATGVHPDTIARGVREVEGVPEPQTRVRAAGGGRKRLAQTDPGLAAELTALVDPETRGDPMSALVWTTKSTRHLAGELTDRGHPVSDRTVARICTRWDSACKATRKSSKAPSTRTATPSSATSPSRSPTTLVLGNRCSAWTPRRRSWSGSSRTAAASTSRAGNPNESACTTSPDKDLGKAIPYGIYDVSANTGWVTVGTDHDTSAFAVATLRSWWQTIGSLAYPNADRLLICADSGGSNGNRIRAWKIELAKLAADTGLKITVCHLPAGTSKWNKIEHRLFSQITLNWRGRPLRTHQVIVDLIRHTTTATGLTVRCVLDTGQYPTGLRYTKKDVDALPITRHDFHGEWNYTINPPDTP